MRTINITDESHVDHLPKGTLDVVLGLARHGKRTRAHVDVPGFTILTVSIPETLDSIPCALRGPMTGEAPVSEEQVFYGTRGTRPNVSRLTRLPATLSRDVTMIIVGDDLATAYGGPLAPQEPGDPYLAPEKHQESVDFWAEHALSVDGSPESSVSEETTFESFSRPAKS